MKKKLALAHILRPEVGIMPLKYLVSMVTVACCWLQVSLGEEM